MRTCSCCGAELPDGRIYTCNARCEAAQARDIEAYLRAADEQRHSFEKLPTASNTILDSGSTAFEVAAAIARSHAGSASPDMWRRR